MLAKADMPRLNQRLCRDYVALYNENPTCVSIRETQRTDQPPRINMSIQNCYVVQSLELSDYAILTEGFATPFYHIYEVRTQNLH